MKKTLHEDVQHIDVRIPLTCPYCDRPQKDVFFRWVGTTSETEHTERGWIKHTCQSRKCKRTFRYSPTMCTGYEIRLKRAWY